MRVAAAAAVAACGAAAQPDGQLFDPRRAAAREPVHVKEDLYPIMCDVCELAAFAAFFDARDKRRDAPIVGAWAVTKTTRCLQGAVSLCAA